VGNEINIDFLASILAIGLKIDNNNFKDSKLFNIFDKNKNGTIDKNEMENIFNNVAKASDTNKNDNREIAYAILDEAEAEALLNQTPDDNSKTFKELGVTVKDFIQFLKSFADKVPQETEGQKIIPLEGKVLDGSVLKSEEEDLSLTPEQAKIAQQFEFISKRGEQQFSSLDCKKLAQLKPEELEIAKQLLYVEGRHEQFSADEIVIIATQGNGKYNIPPQKFSRMSELLSLPNRGTSDLSADGILAVLNLSDKDFEKAKNLLMLPSRASNPLSGGEAAKYIQFGSNNLYEMLLSNPDVVLTEQENRDILSTKINGQEYRYISGQEYPEEITETENGNERIVQIYNPNLKVRQTVTYTNLSGFVKELPSRIETQHLNQNGEVEFTEVAENSDIQGIQHIYRTDNNGNRTEIQTGVADAKTGIQTVRKHLDNGNGTMTDFTLTSNNNNEYNLTYQITDSTKNPPEVKYEKAQSLKKLSDNSYEYTLNGKTYTISQSREKLEITDTSTHSTREIDLSKLIKDDADEIFLERISKIPAELLIFMANHPLDSLDYGNFQANNGHFNPDDNLVEIGNIEFEGAAGDAKSDALLSILLHELGHYLDGGEDAVISGNKEVIEAYNKEVDAFKKSHTSEEQDFITYFTGAAKTERRGRSETIAEMCMLLNTNPKEITEIRAQYLQQYFPETMAIVARLREQVLQN